MESKDVTTKSLLVFSVVSVIEVIAQVLDALEVL
jgi:hypothetical protein